MAPKRIVYLWDADYPWDIRTDKTCRALTAAGHDVHIVARNKKWSPATERLPEGTVHRIPAWRALGRKLDNALGFPAFFNPRWRGLLARTVRNVKADVIIARDLPLCPTANSVGRRYGIPVLFDMAENYPALIRALWDTKRATWVDYFVRNPRMVERVEMWSLKNCDHIVVVVEESGDRLVQMGVDPSKITLVSNTPSITRVQETTSASRHTDRRVDVVYMGNLEVVRGLLESVTAIATLREQGHQVRLRLIGKGRDGQLIRDHAQVLGLGSDAVEFLGWIDSHKEALDIVAAADVGLIPHQGCELWDTTIPNKLFDYMAAGIPVISSDAKPCKRILAQTGAGVTYRSNDADDLAAAIMKMMDPDARQAYGAAGQRAVTERYNWEYDSSVFLGVVNTIRTSVQ